VLPVARISSGALRLLALLALLGALSGCGSALKGGTAARAAEEPTGTCPEIVVATLGKVLDRIYREGIHSERTGAAAHLIGHSLPLRRAIEAGDPTAARKAAQELVATGHMTNLLVRTPSRTLASVGGAALTPLRGTILDAAGRPIATYTTSVWSDVGFAAEGSGVAEGLVALRAGDRSIGGTLTLPPGPLPAQGTLTDRGVAYQYTSLAGQAFPSGAVRIYLFKPLTAIGGLCGRRPEDTQVNTLTRIAQLIYLGERGGRTLAQARRVQADQPLLAAVSRRDPAATRQAVAALLNQHIVRLRVSAGSSLLADVGGPFVLAPVRAPLRLRGRTIGSFVLSIQDDEGYLRLAHRLAGLNVLMYMRAPDGTPRLVKNSLGPAPGTVPASGSYSYRGRSFRVFTVIAEAFPAGPLTIRVLVPLPYS
jgi:hypothetical protein